MPANPFELLQVSPLVHDGDGEAVAQIEANEPAHGGAGPTPREVESARGVYQIHQRALTVQESLEHSGPGHRGRPIHPRGRQFPRAGRDTARKPATQQARPPVRVVRGKAGVGLVHGSSDAVDVAGVCEAEMLEQLARPPATLGRRPVELPAIERAGQLTDPLPKLGEFGEPLRPLYRLANRGCHCADVVLSSAIAPFLAASSTLGKKGPIRSIRSNTASTPTIPRVRLTQGRNPPAPGLVSSRARPVVESTTSRQHPSP